MDITKGLWQHQKDAVDYLDKRQTNGILLHGVGVGKTRTALTYILKRKFKLVLVVGTKKGVRVWQNEVLSMNAPMLVNIFNSGKIIDRAKQVYVTASFPHDFLPMLFVVSYETLSNKKALEYLLKIKWDAIIIDEVHRLRNHTTNQSKAANKLRIANPNAFRLGLTGTIIYTNPLNVFGIFRFIDPGVFGIHWDSFRFKYAVWVGQFRHIPVSFINQEDLRAKVQANAHIVDRHQVLDLPAEQHIVRTSSFSPSELKIYQTFSREYVAAISDTKITAKTVLDKASKLQQLTGGFIYQKDQAIDFSKAKLELLEELLEEIGNERVLIFYRFDYEGKRIADLVRSLDLACFMVNGSIDQYEEFIQAENGVAVVQIASGSESLDFTTAGITIFYSLTQVYGQYIQALGRTSRGNQTRASVAYYYLIIEDTIDEKIYKALKKGVSLVDEILRRDI